MVTVKFLAQCLTHSECWIGISRVQTFLIITLVELFFLFFLKKKKAWFVIFKIVLYLYLFLNVKQVLSNLQIIKTSPEHQQNIVILVEFLTSGSGI